MPAVKRKGARMQSISLNKTRLFVVALAAVVALACSMAFGTQAAYAGDTTGIPVGTTATVASPDKTISQVTVKATSEDEVTITAVKSSKKSVNVPGTLTVNNKVYKVTAIGAKAFKNAKKATKATTPSTVKKFAAKAFAGSKITTVIVKSKSLKKNTVKNCFKGSKVKTVKVPKAKKKAYKKIFTKKNCGKKVTVK